MNPTGWLSKNLIFITGKGGVGKSTVAQACAQYLASQGKKTLLCHVLQLNNEEQRLIETAPNLHEITLKASECFREYIVLKLKLKSLYKAFLSNKIIQYMERAAPGVKEMVVLGKIWFERLNYDHVVVDMPSTGYALTMIHTPFNFAELFPGGPIYRDAKDMIETFGNAQETAFVTVTLAEEMPIQESLELAADLKKLLPTNPSWLVVNRLIRVLPEARSLYANRWSELSKEEASSSLWRALDYLIHRERQQQEQLAGLKESWSPYIKPWLEVEEASDLEFKKRSNRITELILPNPGSAHVG
ncbi:MAG: ArsA family ATPase [Bdellovibrionota bacterium]